MSWQTDFINTIAPIIRQYAIENGYKCCSAMIAQATTESFKGSGLSQLASKHHNYWGMKCGSSWKGASVNYKTGEEYSVGAITTIRDDFRSYANMEEGVKGYFDFLKMKRYQNLKDAETPEQFIALLKQDGWATSSTYVNTNLDRLNRYSLKRWDWETPKQPPKKPTNNPYKLTSKLMKRGSRGESVKWLQYELRQLKYGVEVDGIFGKATELCVFHFQKVNDLVVDGIVGPKTLAKLT